METDKPIEKTLKATDTNKARANTLTKPRARDSYKASDFNKARARDSYTARDCSKNI